MSNQTLNPFAPAKKKEVLRRDQILGGSPEWDELETKPQIAVETAVSKSPETNKILGSINFQREKIIVNQPSNTSNTAEAVSKAAGSTIEGSFKLAGSVLKTTATTTGEISSSIFDLFTNTVAGWTKVEQPIDPKKEEKKQEGLYQIKKNQEIVAALQRVSVDRQQQVAKDVNRMSEGKTTITEVIEASNKNVTVNVTATNTEATISMGLAIVREKEEKKKAAEQQRQSQEVAKASGPVVNLNGAMEGGTAGGKHNMSQSGGGE